MPIANWYTNGTSTTAAVWYQWLTTTSTTSTTTVDLVWSQWCGNDNYSSEWRRLQEEASAREYEEYNQQRQLQARSARLREEVAARDGYEQRLQQARSASERAVELVRLVLGEQMANDLIRGQVLVEGSDGRTYEVRSGLMGNIWILGGEDDYIARVCAHPREVGQPTLDSNLAQVLAIQHDADSFLAQANVHEVLDPVAYEELAAHMDALRRDRLARPRHNLPLAA